MPWQFMVALFAVGLDSYGLGAAVVSNDLERCERLTKVRSSF